MTFGSPNHPTPRDIDVDEASQIDWVPILEVTGVITFGVGLWFVWWPLVVLWVGALQLAVAVRIHLER